MYKLFLLSILLTPSLTKFNYLNLFKNEASNITSLSSDDVRPIFTKDGDKYFYHLETKMQGEVEYIPYTYIDIDGYYQLKDDLSKNVEINPDNFSLNQKLIYIHYPLTYRFEENRFSYIISNHKADREFYSQYNFEYNCSDYKYCLNKTVFTKSYIKSVSTTEGSSDKTNYSLESQKAKFIDSVVSFFSQNLYFKSNEISFNISNYINLLDYGNKFNTFSSRIPLNNIYYWYQGLYPNSDNEKESIYSTYAFNTFNDASDVISNKYYEIAIDESNSHYSESSYSVNGYLDEFIYCNKKYTNIKLYDGYLSKETHNKDEFYLLRLPGLYSDPVAILKEWIPGNYTPELYLKEIIRYYIIDNQVIRKCNYLTPISERAQEYPNNVIYDKETIFLDKLDIDNIKTDLASDIRYTWLSITYKIINSNGTFKISTSNFQNEKGISFDNYGYYKIVETNFYGSKTLNDIILKSDDRKLLQIKSNSEQISDDQLNNPSNQVYLTNKTNSDIELEFPYFDSSLISIKHNGVEKELFNYIDYQLTTINSQITFPKYTISEVGSYVFTISNRFGLSNTIKLNISNLKTDLKIDADNDRFILEINTPDGGLNSISSFYIKRAFYKKENSNVQYELINNSVPYIYEEVRDSSPFVELSKSKEEYLLNNIFTFYPKVDSITYYQVIKIYLKDAYGNIIDDTYKWNYVEQSTNINNQNYDVDVVFDSNTIELDSSIYYEIIKKDNIKPSYEIMFLSGENNLIINKEENKITASSLGESEIRFIFDFGDDINKIIKDYRIKVIEKKQNNNKSKEIQNSSNKIIIVSSISLGVIVLSIVIFNIVNKRKKIKA